MHLAICGPPLGALPTAQDGSIVRMRQVLGGFPQLLFWTLLGLQTQVWSQTAATGALVGEVLDSSGRGIALASVEVRNQDIAVDHLTSSV